MCCSRRAALTGLIVLIWALAIPAAGASTASGDRVLIRQTDVITEDLYASGNSVVIRGRIEGDLVATSFESIVIEGTVEGDVIALTTRLEVSGEIGGSVRGLADQVIISGTVGDDVTVAGRSVRTTGMVGRDLLSFAYQATTTPDARIGRDVRVQVFDSVRLAGAVGGDAEVNADRLVVVDGTTIGGDLRYRATATIGGVSVEGVSIELGRVPTPIRVKTLLLLSVALAGLSVVAVTLLVIWIAPRSLRYGTDAASGWGWISAFLVGVGVVVVPFVVFVGLGVAAGLSSPDFVPVAVIMLVPFLAVWLAALLAGTAVSLVPVVSAVGRRLLPRRSMLPQVLVGLLLAVAAIVLPALGWIVAVALWLTGLGAWSIGLWRARRLDVQGLEPAPG